MPSTSRSWGWLLAASAYIALVAGIASAVDFVGTSFRVEWDPSTGNPDGYVVLTSGPGGTLVEHQRTSQGVTQSEPITGQLGETIIVGVKAYRGDYEGPMSETLSVTLVADAPGAVRIGCPDVLEELVQISADTFICVPR